MAKTFGALTAAVIAIAALAATAQVTTTEGGVMSASTTTMHPATTAMAAMETTAPSRPTLACTTNTAAQTEFGQVLNACQNSSAAWNPTHSTKQHLLDFCAGSCRSDVGAFDIKYPGCVGDELRKSIKMMNAMCTPRGTGDVCGSWVREASPCMTHNSEAHCKASPMCEWATGECKNKPTAAQLDIFCSSASADCERLFREATNEPRLGEVRNFWCRKSSSGPYCMVALPANWSQSLSEFGSAQCASPVADCYLKMVDDAFETLKASFGEQYRGCVAREGSTAQGCSDQIGGSIASIKNAFDMVQAVCSKNEQGQYCRDTLSSVKPPADIALCAEGAKSNECPAGCDVKMRDYLASLGCCGVLVGKAVAARPLTAADVPPGMLVPTARNNTRLLCGATFSEGLDQQEAKCATGHTVKKSNLKLKVSYQALMANATRRQLFIAAVRRDIATAMQIISSAITGVTPSEDTSVRVTVKNAMQRQTGTQSGTLVTFNVAASDAQLTQFSSDAANNKLTLSSTAASVQDCTACGSETTLAAGTATAKSAASLVCAGIAAAAVAVAALAL